MANELAYILIAAFIVSFVSLIGVSFFTVRKRIMRKILTTLVAFSAGSLLGTVFFDLLPESFQKSGNGFFVLFGIVLFFIIESFIHWHHAHDETCEKCINPVVYLTFIGDGIHNFIDGVIIAAGFFISIPSGIAVSLAILFHEIPQELGDFAIFINGGLTRAKALLYNFLSALIAVAGGLVGYFFLLKIQALIPFIIAIAAGNFLYISVSDLMPMLHKEKSPNKRISQLIALLLGILLIFLVFWIFP